MVLVFEKYNNANNNKIDIVNTLPSQLHKTFNATKNHQIVELEYRSKIRRHVNKLNPASTTI